MTTTMTISADHATQLEHKLQTLERYLNQLQDQLVRAQRLAALGTMTSLIVHEFNNMLTPVVSYSQVAIDRDDPELMRRALSQAHKNGQKAVDFAQQVLGFAKGSEQGDQANVRDVVDTALKVLVRDLGKDNIELTRQIDSAEVKIQPRLLQQVLYNLIINARQAMLGKPGRLSIKSSTCDGTVRIELADTGAGIDPEILPNIFDPFFTTKSQAKRPDMQGTGLGLAVCRYIVEQAGGAIAVTSTLGEGTCFTITLPIAN